MLSMRVFVLSDSHDDFETLEKALDFVKAESADLLLIAGDYILRTHSAKDKEECTSEGRLDRSAFNGKILGNAAETYRRIEDLLDECGVPALLVPGNHDLKNYSDFFEGRDLHLKSKRLREVVKPRSIDDLVIAGYGGDGMVAVPSSSTLTFPCSEKELYQHLDATKPDIVLLHCPPKKTTDATTIHGKQVIGTYIGSTSARRYMVENAGEGKPKLIVCGHRHGTEISVYRDTVIVNPGNLGRFFGDKEYGTFLEVQLEKDGSVTEVIHYSAKEDKVIELGRMKLPEK